MKRIAYVSDAWHGYVSYVMPKALLDSFSDYEEDVILCHFNSFGSWSRNEKNNAGEYGIYDLPDFTGFDGIVLDINTIVDMAQVEKLVRVVKSANIPTITIGFEVEGFYYAGIDNEKPIYEIMEHLYSVHGCRSFVFAGGPLSNSENSLRVQAYNEYLALRGLSNKDNPVLIGNFDFMTGCRHFETIVEKHIPIPDAFVCTNDNIAAGLISQAQKYGYSVPEDFLVTGFDNLDKALFFEPQVTTVGHKREKVGEVSAKILKDVWAGKDVPVHNFTDVYYFFTESCGCPQRDDVDYRDYSCSRIISAVQKEVNESHLFELEGALSECEEFDEIFEKTGEFFKHMECDEVYFFVDDRLYNADPLTEFPKNEYDWKHLKMVYAFEDKIKSRYKSCIDIIGHLEREGRNNYYFFSPIHFGDYTVGFSILKNAGFIGEESYFYDVHSTIVKTLNNLFNKKQLENANEHLKEIYLKDILTGVYNRVAFTQKIIPKLTSYHKKGVECVIAFSDTDNFKTINDKFGHSYGDRVLRIIGTTLSKLCPPKGIVCRFGGDEFVVFFPITDGVSMEKFKDNVLQTLANDNISISMGIVKTNPSSAKSFDEYISEADQMMYEEKKRKKTESRNETDNAVLHREE